VDAEARLAALEADRERGASEITDDALTLYRRLARSTEPPVDAVADAGARLVEAHPAMAPLVTATSQALAAIREGGPDGVDDVREARRSRARAVAREGARLVPGRGAVAAYSRSSTVVAALRRALEAGRTPTVRVSEARPGGEGLGVARELTRDGARVTVTADADLIERAGRAEAVFVGADAICRAGLVNKTGTGALVREAARAGTPAYVLATTDKRMPPEHRERPPLTASGRLDPDLPRGVREAAPLFSCEPLGAVEAVVTEDGPTPPDAVLDGLDEVRLDPALAERL
jgi:translation initiation factor 2B subunit (eIF-2B alpha/beta/delta family)